MKRRIAPAITLLTLSLLTACGGGDGEPSPAGDAAAPTTVAGGAGDTGGGAGNSGGGASGSGSQGSGGASGTVDPNADLCALFTPAELEATLGMSGLDTGTLDSGLGNPDQQCSWRGENGDSFWIILETDRPGADAYAGMNEFLIDGRNPIENNPFPAHYAEVGQSGVVDGVIAGYYVSLNAQYGDDFDSPRDGLVELGVLAGTRLVPFASAAAESAAGATTTTSGDVQLTVTFTAPAALTSTATNASIGSGAFIVCPVKGRTGTPWVLTYAANVLGGGAGSTLPVRQFAIGIDAGITGPGTYDADISVVDGAETNHGGKGKVTIDAGEAGGTFEVNDVRGTWSC